MRRKISTLLMTSAIILSALLIPTVFASKPIPASGTWDWYAPSSTFTVKKIVGGNMFIHAYDNAIFTGTFEGTGTDEFTMTVHDYASETGFATGNGRTHFTGTVEGKTGTLDIMWVGNTKNDLGYWWFKWIIISGTGELANLRGQGTSWGPGPPGTDAWGGVDYTGKIHFDPS